MRIVLLAAFFWPLLSVAQATAAPFPVPQWREGKHVYVLPEGWQPPLFGPRDLQELEQAASALKYPFYVVIAQRLDGHGDGDRLAAEAVDGIAQAWAERSGGYDVGTSQVFLLSFEPRKYRFLAGKRWGTELGFERDAHKPHTRLFERAVQGTPKDPKGGMIALMRSVDAYLADQTDPVKIAARKKAAELADARQALDAQIALLTRLLASDDGLSIRDAEHEVLPRDADPYRMLLYEARELRSADDAARIRAFVRRMEPKITTLQDHVDVRQAEVKRLTNARGALDANIVALDGLLSEDAVLLPEDTSSYRDLLAKAWGVRNADDPAQMQQFAGSMTSSIGVLKAYVEQRRDEERGKAMLRMAKILCLLAFIGLILALLARHAVKYGALKKKLAEEVKWWSERVSNASGRYVEFHGLMADMKKLLYLEGQTKSLADGVAKEVDDIFSAVKAMEAHVQRCEYRGGKATFFDLKPLREAIDAIGSTFGFDTGALNPDDLFGSETKVITVEPQKFSDELQTRFKDAMVSWTLLKDALGTWMRPAKELFPQDVLDGLIAEANCRNIPLLWLNDHPLFGDDAADQALYDGLDAVNTRDPVAFAAKLRDLKEKEAEIAKRFERLAFAVDSVTKERSDAPLSDHGLVLDPDDDPAVSYDRALRAEAGMAGALGARRDAEEVVGIAVAACGLYAECRAKAAAVASATEAVESAARRADDAMRAAREAGTAAEAAVAEACKVHRTVDTDALMARGRERCAQGERKEAAADDLREGRKLLSAARLYANAASAFADGKKAFDGAVAVCAALDAKRAEYEKTLASMHGVRERIAGTIRKYDSSPSRLKPFSVPDTSGPADYAALLVLLIATQNSWKDQERRAQQVWQAEQDRLRRIREEEERRRRAEQRRRDEAAAAARRRSSSGGSWGGGGSSSSGGGWGGGGSSSSGGGW